MASSEPPGVRFSVRPVGQAYGRPLTDQPQTGGLNKRLAALATGSFGPGGDRPAQAPLMRFCAPSALSGHAALTRACQTRSIPLRRSAPLRVSACAAVHPSPTLLHPGLFGHGPHRRCPSRPFVAGFFACDVSGRRPRASRDLAGALLRPGSAPGVLCPSQLLFLRPGQRDVSITHTPHAVFRKSASIDFRRGVGRVFYLQMAADLGASAAATGFFPGAVRYAPVSATPRLPWA